MIIIPAIDLKEGLVVRLLQGRFNEQTIYSKDPCEVARKWERLGAKLIHVVDLDGAETGALKNLKVIEAIVKAIKIPIEVGGGIRKKEDIDTLFKMGASRVVIGTKVLEDEEFLKESINKWQEKIIVSIDASHGRVAEHGWKKISDINAIDLAKKIETAGVKEVIYTDISRDGTLLGPNIKGIREILEAVKIAVIASGGVSSLEDISQLKNLEAAGLKGIIIGKALYEGAINLEEAIKLCSPKG